MLKQLLTITALLITTIISYGQEVKKRAKHLKRKWMLLPQKQEASCDL